MIVLEDGFSIFYRQERVGLDGRLFKIIKFRSMRNDAESDGKPRWAMVDDDRVTRVGRVLRKLRIDELPQLYNVLTGDMSLVGPRPERPYFVDQLTRDIPFFAVRHSVKPGLTGWAQVSYHYGSTIDDAVQKLQNSINDLFTESTEYLVTAVCAPKWFLLSQIMFGNIDIFDPHVWRVRGYDGFIGIFITSFIEHCYLLV
jgi:lipopolysaccharide/colanic/teichoic acid biosynthesis glycosyltransferase